MSNPVIVSIVIVTHNSLPRVRECLQSLRAADGADRRELIVVDNGSTDGTLDVVRELCQAVLIVRNDGNVGFATACNQGASKARGEYLFFLNPDVCLDRDAISTLVRVDEENPKAGLVSARLRNPDGSFQPTCRNLPTVATIFFSRGSLLGRILPGRNVYTLGDSTDVIEVPAVAATAVMIKRELFARLGGFDTRFFMYMEDTDLSLRLGRNGYENLFVPAAGGVHYWGEGSRAGRVRRAVRHHCSVYTYFLKHVPNGFSTVLLPALLAVNLLLVVLLAPFRRGKSW